MSKRTPISNNYRYVTVVRVGVVFLPESSPTEGSFMFNNWRLFDDPSDSGGRHVAQTVVGQQLGALVRRNLTVDDDVRQRFAVTRCRGVRMIWQERPDVAIFKINFRSIL